MILYLVKKFNWKLCVCLIKRLKFKLEKSSLYITANRSQARDESKIYINIYRKFTGQKRERKKEEISKKACTHFKVVVFAMFEVPDGYRNMCKIL